MCTSIHHLEVFQLRLSRQIFQTQKLSTSGEADEDCNQANHSLLADIGVNLLDRQRELAASFFPGQVSAGLREALFWDSNLEHADPDFMDPEQLMPWYHWFEKWGTDKLDPFKAVTHRLAELDEDLPWTSTQVLEMHRGESPPLNSNEEAVSSVVVPPNLPLDVTSIDAPLPSSPPLLPLSSGRSRRLRIVKYSGARFCHDHLPVYNGQMLKRKQTYLKMRQPPPTRYLISMLLRKAGTTLIGKGSEKSSAADTTDKFFDGRKNHPYVREFGRPSI
ncbi:uncharacterized protein MELLADRAFT_95836 [Melampsora larici-populina 98AG31]|uniref:Uncharacterized protein n=1 Tax=Melampsora larici-populina (strain 98AG31 / pathotype 3-4-7) TaxID=747676 RepID=F4RDF0_MELLP|nr:uncharacterized protein MELLADRAFT_95836 [Melampsora larici-populina 98AG31]EGG09621.1 hypothetical protein MELLADRAFT_95836 [Melampsora larici-populina 98AG31]